MKTIARIATAAVAALVSMFVASPAFASEGGTRIDMTDQFSTAGDPLQVGAILIVGFVLLAVVLVLSLALSAPFEKK